MTFKLNNISISLTIKLLVGSICFIAFMLSTEKVKASDYQVFDTARFTLHMGSNFESSVNNIKIDNSFLAKEALNTLSDTYKELTETFGLYTTKKVTLRFLEPREFTKRTGAPSWTNAMYYRGEISIPLSKSNLQNIEDINHAIKHEYVHAYLAEVTRHRCPAWIDEGLAQLIEGKPNPLLGPSLRKWIKNNDAIELTELQNGFTTLDSSIVPAAYAQSLFVSRKLVKENGWEGIREYLLALRKGETPENSFKTAFKTSKEDYEKTLTEDIKSWSRTNQRHP